MAAFPVLAAGGLIVLAAGCCSLPNEDGVAEYRRRHPVEAKRYTALKPVTADWPSMVFRVKSTTITGIAHSLQQDFGSVPGLADYAHLILKQEQWATEQWEQNRRELEAAAAGGGGLYFFEWSDGVTRESGLLVIRSGEVIKREPWLTENLSTAQRARPGAATGTGKD